MFPVFETRLYNFNRVVVLLCGISYETLSNPRNESRFDCRIPEDNPCASNARFICRWLHNEPLSIDWWTDAYVTALSAACCLWMVLHHVRQMAHLWRTVLRDVFFRISLYERQILLSAEAWSLRRRIVERSSLPSLYLCRRRWMLLRMLLYARHFQRLPATADLRWSVDYHKIPASFHFSPSLFFGVRIFRTDSTSVGLQDPSLFCYSLWFSAFSLAVHSSVKDGSEQFSCFFLSRLAGVFLAKRTILSIYH